MAPDLEQELERTTALRGFRYGLHDFVGFCRNFYLRRFEVSSSSLSNSAS